MRVLYIDIDCLRNDHLGCYGYGRSISPTLDALAEDGVCFSNCYTSNSPCTPSRTALFTGRFGIETDIVQNRGNGRPVELWAPAFPEGRSRTEVLREMPTLPRLLLASGVRPVAFTNFLSRHQSWWLGEGWQGLHQVNLKNGFDTADEVNAAVLPWLERNAADDNWFLWLNYWDTHFPYRSGDMNALIKEVQALGPRNSWPDEATIERNYRETIGSRTAREPWGFKGEAMAKAHPWMPSSVRTRADHDRMIDCYDATLLYVDRHVLRVLEALDEAGVLHDTVIIVSGDHGDSFGEQGHYMDHTLGNDPVMRRPLIACGPGISPQPRMQDGLCYLGDLAATIVALFNAEVPTGWSFESLLPAMRGEPTPGRPYLVCDHGMAGIQRAVRFDRYLAIHTLYQGTGTAVPDQRDGPRPSVADWWLYDLVEEPHQTTDMAADRPDLIEQARTFIDSWRADHPGPRRERLDSLEYYASSLAKEEPSGGPVAELRRRGREEDALRLQAQRAHYRQRWYRP